MSSPNPPAPNQTGMFSEPAREKSFPTAAVAMAAVVIVVAILVLVLTGRHKDAGLPANTLVAPAAYAPNLFISGVQMSEADVPSGGKQTYIDGHIANHGPSTVTGITVQAVFANDQAMPPEIETVPLTLIRMREPYIDIGPVSAAPLAPGTEADFRLIFESVNANWNQQQPELRVVRVATK